MTNDVDRRTALGTLAGGSSVLVGAHAPIGLADVPPVALRDDAINVVDFGARADGTSDNATAFDRAVERGLAMGKPLFIPPSRDAYATSRPLRPLTGMVGMGRASCIKALTPDAFGVGQAIVHVGWTRRENGDTCRVPLQGFRVMGAARRTERRSGNAADAGFTGIGILYDEMVGPTHATHISVSHCYKGISHANATGHLGGTALDVSNCWYNLYWERNTGDYRYYDSVFTGALFASYGCHGENRIDGADPGGIGGLLLSGCHGGFSPYGFFQEAGDGTVGLVGLTLQNSSFEQIGNAVVHLGRQTSGKSRVSCNWDVTTPGHSWTDHSLDAAAYDAYTIPDDPRHPIQDVAVSLDLVQGGPLFLRGNCWAAGRSGYHTRIHDLLEWIEDSRGSQGYDIVRQGRERVLSLPRSFTAWSPLPAHGEPPSDIIRFDVPGWIGNAVRGTIEIAGSADNTSGRPIRLDVRVTRNDGAPQPVGSFSLPPGHSDYSFRRWFDPGSAGRQTQRDVISVELKGNVREVVLSANDVAGQVALTLSQG